MITINDLTLRRGTKLLFDHAQATIFDREKIGVVGRNGIGKSSLFAVLAKRLHEDGGECTVPAHWRIAEVSQQMPESTQIITDFVIAGDTRLMQAREQLIRANAHAEQQQDWSEIGNAHHALADAGDYTANARAEQLLLGLGFTRQELALPVNHFSGGWRMRLQLARTLIADPELLLLDEPTNHLDMDALVWLEGYLQKFSGTILMISHDRDFLDAICTAILHIDQGLITRYGGNYQQFEETRAEKITLQRAQYHKQQKTIAHFQSFIDRFRAQATKAKQAQSRMKAIERMEKIMPVIDESEFTFSFRESEKIPNPLLTVHQGAFGYNDGEHQREILRPMNQTLLAGQRIGLLGANGQGKSTWIKTIAGVMPLLAGEIHYGKGLKIGYFAQQEMEVLIAKESPLEHFMRLAKDCGRNEREVDLRSFLGSFNFLKEQVHQPVGTMSGGEKARLVLAMVVWQSPNLLLLDEPTNHLDLLTREALSMAINTFEGTVIVVSHDRALLRAVCDQYWLVAEGSVQAFEGDLEDYQSYLIAQNKLRREFNNKPPMTVKTPTHNELSKVTKFALSSSERRNLEKKSAQIEEKIQRLEAEQQSLSNIALHRLTTQERANYRVRQNDHAATLANLEAQWFELQEQLMKQA